MRDKNEVHEKRFVREKTIDHQKCMKKGCVRERSSGAQKLLHDNLRDNYFSIENNTTFIYHTFYHATVLAIFWEGLHAHSLGSAFESIR